MSNMTFYIQKENHWIPIDGSAPYIHWAPQKFSTGLYRTWNLFFHIPGTTQCRVELLTQIQRVFYIYDPTVPLNEEYGGLEWGNVDNVLKDQAILEPVGGGWYQLVLVARADTAGEFITDLLIEGTVYKIGAVFEGENEFLSANLVNQGQEIPSLIYKALYQTDPYEESPDWVLMNRKLRELLSNFLDVIGNKGSYKSLLNSLSWFDYGNTVKLKEVWRYDTPDGAKYFESSIQELVTEEITRRYFQATKTTYFSLVHPIVSAFPDEKELISTTYNGDPEEKHDARKLAMSWTLEEMRLKLVLLAGFWENYFMPIHVHLFRAVAEDITRFDSKQIFSSHDNLHEECFSETGNFELAWTSDQMDTLVSDKGTSGSDSDLYLYLDEVRAIAGLDREDPYGNAFENTVVTTKSDDYKGVPYIPIIACHDIEESNATPIEKMEWAYQFFHGIGTLATASFTCPEPIINGTCETDTHGYFITTQLVVDESAARENFSIQFLFPLAGTYRMILNLEGASHRTYSKRITIHVSDNLQPSLDIYLVKGIVDVGSIQPNPFPATTTSPLHHIWSRTKEPDYEIRTENGLTFADLGADWESDFQYIPICPANRPVPSTPDAPSLTTMYTLRIHGTEEAISRWWDPASRTFTDRLEGLRDKAGYSLVKDCWYRTGDGTNEETGEPYFWIQWIYKRRGQEGIWFYPEELDSTTEEHFTQEIFFPELCRLEKPGSGELVSREYPIAIQPVIKIHATTTSGEVKKVPFSYHLKGKNKKMWEFYSWQIQADIAGLSQDIQEPFLAWDYNAPIPGGYYTIRFRYDFGTGERMCETLTNFRLSSAPTVLPG